MRLERAINLQSQLVNSVIDLYSLARACHLTSSQINERFNRLFEPFPKLPNHVRQFVRGYREALTDRLYHQYLQYGYEWNGIVYPANWDTLPEELKEALRKGTLVTHGHYWNDTLATPGQAKPFFLGSKGN